MVEKQIYTVKEAAMILGLSVMTVWRHCKAGTIPSSKLSSKILIPKAHIDGLANPQMAAKDGDEKTGSPEVHQG